MNNKVFSQIANEATDVNGAQLAALQQLVYYCNDKGECWPRTRKLAKHLHVSVRETQRLLVELKRKGYVRVIQKGSAFAPPVYRIALPREGDVGYVRYSAENMQDVALRSEENVRDGAKSGVPAQAGTNPNHNKEQKGEQGGPLDKREKPKSAIRRCARVTGEAFCGVYAEKT